MNMEELKTKNLWRDLSHTAARPLLCRYDDPWEILDELKGFIEAYAETLSPEEYDAPAPGVRIAKSATVAHGVTILPPCVIGERTEIRPGAYLRGGVLVGNDAVVGNSTELKNCVLFDGVQVPHFNYVGDSILGTKAHLGAGAVTSNVKSDKSDVTIHAGNEAVPTGRRKLGALLGDGVEVGCNAVLNPGTVIGTGSVVYPLSSVRGYVPPDCICKGERGIFPKKK